MDPPPSGATGGVSGGVPAGQPPEGAVRRRAPQSAAFGSNAIHVNDEVVDKLMILNYEEGFCARKDITPFPRTYFAISSDNVGQQFAHFMELVKYLMGMCDHEFTTDKYDDPNTSVNRMMLELKGMGFEMDFPAQKLKQAHGEAVCRVLNFLCDQALALAGFHWQKPTYPDEDFAEEAEVDEEAEVAQGIEDETGDAPGEEIMYEDLVRGGAEGKAEEEERHEVLEPTVDPIAWKTELERVSQRLKVSGAGSAGKEWRAHLEQTMAHEKTIHEVLPDTQMALKKIATEVGGVLERLVAKEKYINTHFEHLADEYRTEQEEMATATESYTTSTAQVTKLTQELSVVQDNLEEIKGTMDDRGHSMTDASPLIKIKSALGKLKGEIKTMDLRIGVVGHTLMQARARMKPEEVNDEDVDFEPEDDEFVD